MAADGLDLLTAKDRKTQSQDASTTGGPRTSQSHSRAHLATRRSQAHCGRLSPNLDMAAPRLPAEESEATFALQGEDHTLGNALRFMLNKSPNVAFAARSLPR